VLTVKGFAAMMQQMGFAMVASKEGDGVLDLVRQSPLGEKLPRPRSLRTKMEHHLDLV
jgi:hypothetical protein